MVLATCSRTRTAFRTDVAEKCVSLFLKLERCGVGRVRLARRAIRNASTQRGGSNHCRRRLDVGHRPGTWVETKGKGPVSEKSLQSMDLNNAAAPQVLALMQRRAKDVNGTGNSFHFERWQGRDRVVVLGQRSQLGLQPGRAEERRGGQSRRLQ